MKRREKGEDGIITAFIGAKGGVGTTTIALHTAAALSRPSKTTTAPAVLALEATNPAGSFLSWLDFEDEQAESRESHGLVGAIQRLSDADPLEHTLVPMELGFGVLAGPRRCAARASLRSTEVRELLRRAAPWFDHLIVDLSPTLDAVEVEVLDQSDVVVVVTDASVASVRATRAMLETLFELDVPSGSVRVAIDHPRPRHRSELGPQVIADALARPVDFTIPFCRRMVESSERRTLRTSRSRALSEIEHISEELWDVATRGESA